MKKYKFSIKGIHCDSCSTLIEGELNGRKGVSMSKINNESGKAVVIYDENVIDPAEIKRLVEKAGKYKVKEDIDEHEDKKKKKNPVPEKKSFFFGLIIGIAVLAIIGFLIVLGLYLSQKTDAPIVAANNQVEKVNNQPAPAPSPTKKPASAKVNIEILDGDHIRGNENAPITIVEFSDYQCSYCSRFHTTMKQVLANYPDEVRWVYKHFPLDSIHPVARKAAEAAECAGDQDKFWEYSDELFDNQRSITVSSLSTTAKTLGLDVKEFDSCLESGKYEDKVKTDLQQGAENGVRGTPGNFINGQSVPGAVPYEQLESIIESLL